MKKLIIITSIVTVLTILGLLSWRYFASFTDISFSIKQPDITVELYEKSKPEDKIASFVDAESTIKLQNGDYYYIARGEKIGLVKSVFTVKGSSKNISIDPYYSSAYLANNLKSERNTILEIIKNTYPDIIGGYDILDGKLFNKGEWYGTIIKKKINPNDITDLYRVIMHKEGDKWVMVHYPEIVATQKNFPDVPIDILKSVNSLSDS